jgi:hypothetical protein
MCWHWLQPQQQGPPGGSSPCAVQQGGTGCLGLLQGCGLALRQRQQQSQVWRRQQAAGRLVMCAQACCCCPRGQAAACGVESRHDPAAAAAVLAGLGCCCCWRHQVLAAVAHSCSRGCRSGSQTPEAPSTAAVLRQLLTAALRCLDSAPALPLLLLTLRQLLQELLLLLQLAQASAAPGRLTAGGSGGLWGCWLRGAGRGPAPAGEQV